MLTETLSTPISFLLWVAGAYLAIEVVMLLIGLLAIFASPYDVSGEDDIDE